LPLGRCADENLAVFLIRDDGGRGASAFRILDHFRLAAFHDGDAAVRRAEVDADDLAHGFSTSDANLGCLCRRWGFRSSNQGGTAIEAPPHAASSLGLVTATIAGR